MSHFVAVVLAQAGTDEIHRKVEDLLAPYDENLEVEPYERPCWCVRHKAVREVEEQLKAEFEERFAELRRRNAELIELERQKNPEYSPPLLHPHPEFEDEWLKLDRERQARREELLGAHPLKDQPDPACECGGTGREITTYNPNSKWDWWQVGGRWTGFFTEGDEDPYDPALDPRNYEPCPICDQTGKRYWRERVLDGGEADDQPLARVASTADEHGERVMLEPASADDPLAVERPCNACDGTGQRLSFSFAPFDGDVVPARRWAEKVMQGHCIPFAVVTPDGEWHERGEMGCFGIVRNEKLRDEWEEEVREIASQVAGRDDLLAVAVDLHI